MATSIWERKAAQFAADPAAHAAFLEKQRETYARRMARRRSGFGHWVVSQFLGEDGLLGDLARDLRDDQEWPHNGPDWYFIYYYYLQENGACDGAWQAFEDAWKQYEAAGLAPPQPKCPLCGVPAGFDPKDGLWWHNNQDDTEMPSPCLTFWAGPDYDPEPEQQERQSA